MRWAAVARKIVERHTEVATAADVFNAATLGGAQALGRDDLGRIAPGAKADSCSGTATLVSMTPLRDPIKNIVYSAQAEDLDTVIIDGEIRDEGPPGAGRRHRKLALDLQAAGERMWPDMAQCDWAGRDADELSPQSFPEWR